MVKLRGTAASSLEISEPEALGLPWHLGRDRPHWGNEPVGSVRGSGFLGFWTTYCSGPQLLGVPAGLAPRELS